MRYVELNANEAKYILPKELEHEYQVLPPNAVEIDIDADVHIGDVYENGVFRHKTNDELIEKSRFVFETERTRRFNEMSWVRERHSDRVELGIDDSENWKFWLSYWQALRDMPQQAGFDPREPKWPQKPE